MIQNDYFCSTLSLEAQEPLYGSAPEKTVWLLLEYVQPWGAKAFPESNLAEPVKAHISAFLDNDTAANILFIRQPGRRRDGIKFFVAAADEQKPRLYEFTLSSYDDLCSLDLAAVSRGEYPESLSNEPLFLVCTNSKRDKCCAKYGVGIYTELQRQRKDKDLQLDLHFDQNFDGWFIAPFLLQPLVENAFKFVDAPPHIHISGRMSGKVFTFLVENSTGPASPTTDSKTSGIGLENLRRRLELLYPGRHQLDITKEENVFKAKLNLELK